MLIRPKEFRDCGQRFNDRVKLSPGETKEARWEAWLAEKTTGIRHCGIHPRSRLVLDTTQSTISPAFAEFDYHSGKPEPGLYWFGARLHCDACCCAYALCPPEFLETTFGTFDTSTPERSRALVRCREFAAQVTARSCGFLLMVGGPGSGKTRLACNIISPLGNADPLYVRQAELTLALRATYRRKDVVLHRSTQWANDEASSDEPPTPLEIVQRVRLLVLDEIGCNPLANDERLLLDELVKHRYEHRKPTILISNLPLDQFRDFVGDAVSDRIVEATGNRKFLLQFKGGSFRRTAGENYLAGLASICTPP